jgi:hypothetical protein
MYSRRTRIRSAAASLGVAFAVLAFGVPAQAASNITVPSIPGAGWIQGPDNTAGRTAVIAASPVAGLGKDSVKLTSTGTSDVVGIGRVIPDPVVGLTGASWMTYVAGNTGDTNAEPAALRFGLYRTSGTSVFTTLVVERSLNATVTPGVWQTTTMSDSTLVWQTNALGNFCLQAAPCTFGAFKAKYDGSAHFTSVQVAVGPGTGATSSYVDGISLTLGEVPVTESWDFELPAQAPTPTPKPTTTPPATSTAALATDSRTLDGGILIILSVVGLLALLSVRLRRSESTS